MKKLGRKGKEKQRAMDALKREYFSEYGELYEDKKIAPCQRCQSWETSLDYHHVIKRSLGGKETKENGMFLCRFCHMLIHERERYDSKKTIG